MPDEIISLKWGTLKGWNNIHTDAAMALLQKYHEIGVSFGAMSQKDTPEQKQILVDLVSLPGMTIYLDWDGKYVSQTEAVEYLNNYGKEQRNV